MGGLSVGVPRLVIGWRELQRLGHLSARGRRRESAAEALALFREPVNEDARLRRVEKSRVIVRRDVDSTPFNSPFRRCKQSLYDNNKPQALGQYSIGVRVTIQSAPTRQYSETTP